jgi:hypothetical protein
MKLVVASLLWAVIASPANANPDKIRLTMISAEIDRSEITQFEKKTLEKVAEIITKDRGIPILVLDRSVPADAPEDIGKTVKNTVEPAVLSYYNDDPDKITYFSNPKSPTVSQFMVPNTGNDLKIPPPLVKSPRILIARNGGRVDLIRTYLMGLVQMALLSKDGVWNSRPVDYLTYLDLSEQRAVDKWKAAEKNLQNDFSVFYSNLVIAQWYRAELVRYAELIQLQTFQLLFEHAAVLGMDDPEIRPLLSAQKRKTEAMFTGSRDQAGKLFRQIQAVIDAGDDVTLSDEAKNYYSKLKRAYSAPQ